MKTAFYTANRKKVLDRLPKNTLVVVAGNYLLQKSADMTFPFRQDSNFKYLAGVNESELVLVFSKNQSFIIAPKRSEFTSLWDGQQNFEQIKQRSGVDEVLDQRAGWQKMKHEINGYLNVALMEPVGRLPWGGEANPGRAKVKKRLKHYLTQQVVMDLRPILAELRMIKTAEELSCIKQAIEITRCGYEAVIKALPKLKYEYELEAVFAQSFKHQNSNFAYDPIIASGPRSCILHYQSNDQSISGNHILFDVAAEFEEYAADISRTVPHTKPFSKRQLDIHKSLERVHDKTAKNTRPGMTFVEINDLMMGLISEELVSLGLSAEPNLEDAQKYLPHSSHFIGLDVHDAGDYRAPLKSGCVFTLEPGIYIPEENLGFRLEDMFLMTDSGLKNLSKNIPLYYDHP